MTEPAPDDPAPKPAPDGRGTRPAPDDPAPKPATSGAIAALARSGLLASGETALPAEAADLADARLVGQPWAAVRPILAELGFAAVAANGDGARTYAAYDRDADRWLWLRLHSGQSADDPARRSVRGPNADRGPRNDRGPSADPGPSADRGPRKVRAPRNDRAPGLVVAVLGPDGAGKSSLTAAVARSFILPVREFYAGLYPADRRRFSKPGLATIALLLRLWRLAVGAAWHRRRGRLVLFDRYAYDARLPLPPSAGRRTRLRRALLARSLPTPDLVVVLDAPAEVLLSRRREHPIEVVEAQRRRYAELAASVPDGVIVDASPDADSVRRTVTDLIWRRYVGRQIRRPPS